jgi:predicted nucleic acid-binding protein
VVLVDTSVWIEAFRSRGMLMNHVDIDDVVTCPVVIQEVLQGFRYDRYLHVARQTFLAMPILEAPMEIEVFEEAAELYRRARSAGFTIRSSADCLIAVCAMRAGARLLHSDRDFDTIARFTTLDAQSILM